jgi:hypothetical protein
MFATSFGLFWLTAQASAASWNWMASEHFFQGAGHKTIHESRSGVLIQSHHPSECRYPKSDRVIDRSYVDNGVDHFEIVKLDDPAHDAKQMVREGSPDRSRAPGYFYDALVRAGTPPAWCDREVQYRIDFGGEDCRLLAAVPCSSEQREALDAYARLVASRQEPRTVDKDSSKRGIVMKPADLAALVPGTPAEQVVKDFGIPNGSWPRFPDAFSLLYISPDGPGEITVMLDFDRNRQFIQGRLLKHRD